MKVIDFKKGKVLHFIDPLTNDFNWDLHPLSEISDEDLVATYIESDDGMYNHFQDSIEWDYYNDIMNYIKPELERRNIKRKNDKENFTVIYYID